MGECIKFGRGKLVLYDPKFANNEWDKIIAACQSGNVPDTWKVGDQKVMTIGGEDYKIDIIGINHDDYSDGSGKAPLTFQIHDGYEQKYITTKSGNADGWTNCTVRTTHLPTILSQMPTEVQNGIREVNKLTSAGNNSNTINTTADKLFLLSEIEVLGNYNNSKNGEGSRYTYYSSGNSRIKTDGTNYKISWWLRSPCNNTTQYCYIWTDGTCLPSGNSNNLYLVPAFCF
jgi:hypothetical protein